MRSMLEELGEHELTRGMRPEHLAQLASCARNVVFMPGTWVCREGEAADTCWLLRAGQVTLEVTTPAGRKHTVETMEEGGLLGCAWLAPPYQTCFDARVLRPTRAIALDGACLRAKTERDPSLGSALFARVARVLSQRLSAARVELAAAASPPRLRHGA